VDPKTNPHPRPTTGVQIIRRGVIATNIVPDLRYGTVYVEHEGDWSVGAVYDHPQYGPVTVLAILQNWKGDNYEVELAIPVKGVWTTVSPW